ncbi:MAG: group I truncated hemoglobin [Bdellovibrionota bacterium]
MDFDLLKRQILTVNKSFYDRIYKDSWMSLVFKVVPQEHIEMQQTDFMLGALGGPKQYCGRSPADAHPHIYVDEEMWQLRERYLKEAFVETGFPEELRPRWIKIDEAFKKAILKNNLADCKKRFTMDEIIYFPGSAKKKAG